jgi:hypothetical protein
MKRNIHAKIFKSHLMNSYKKSLHFFLIAKYGPHDFNFLYVIKLNFILQNQVPI